MGRHKIPLDKKQTYSRPAVYPQTYERIKFWADKDGDTVVDWLEKLIKPLPEKRS